VNPNKYFPILLFLFLFSNKYIFAQDSTNAIKVQNHKPKLVLSIDLRHSFVRESPIVIYGGNIGFKFKNRHQISLGYYTLTNNSKYNIKLKNQQTRQVDDDLTLSYGSLIYIYSIINSRHWELRFPLEIGYGQSNDVVKNAIGKTLTEKKTDLFPAQIGFLVHWKFTRWIGVKGSIGYRNMLASTSFQDQFNGMYYTYGLDIFIGNIIQDLKRKKSKD